MKKTVGIIISIFIACCIPGPPVSADWINLSGAQNAPNIAEIYINDDHVKIELEIFVKDIVTFDRLIPDEFFQGTSVRRPSLPERMRQFSNEDLQIIADKKEKLQATLILAEPRFRQDRPSPYAWKINPFTLQPIPGPPKDKRVLYAELIYPFKKKPSSLTIISPLDAEIKISKVPIGFMTYHKGAPLHDFKYLSGPSTVTFDWADPWYSQFEKNPCGAGRSAASCHFSILSPMR